MIKKKILYIDMDGVIVDLGKAIEDWFNIHPEDGETYKTPDLIPDIFKNPKPINGAIESINKLAKSGKYEIVISTTAPWGQPESGMDKRYWIERYFGEMFKKQLIITHRKDLLIGDYLIDDRLANGAKDFKGELLHFGWDYENKEWNKYYNWDTILKKLL